MRVFLYHEFWKKEEEENQTGSEGKGEEGLGSFTKLSRKSLKRRIGGRMKRGIEHRERRVREEGRNKVLLNVLERG